VLTYLLTRNVTKMLAVLMVDFSCALKLSMPIAVLSAMRECSSYHISVKGGRFLEAVAQADTVVFDKTGTLTYAVPTVQDVVPFGGHDAQEMLRLAACLEEHYPHSMATAVVEEAKHRGLSHEEYHSQVQYIVAHGISSMVNGEKTLIGSAHFVFEDEGCTIPAGEQERFDALPTQYSHLYLCLAGQLSAVICIHDPLRAEAKDAIRALHDCGIRKVVMMTGDNRRTAACVAEEVGVDEFHAEVLPEIAEALKGSGVKILVDGGIRTGGDVFKALALGADAVLVARPYVTAVYGGGAEGVACLTEKLGAELADTMRLCGAAALKDISRDMVRV
jgi:P-type E1-E2 ATPase